MSDSYYNVVVVGTELTGLITAAMLAKKGYRVLVLGHGHQANRFQHEGYTCVRRPWLFSGFETSRPIKKVFAELSLSLEMRYRPKPFDPFYQVILPEKRVDIVAKESLLQRELAREFPDQADQIQTFYRAVRAQNDILSGVLDSGIPMPPDGFMEKRAFKKLMLERLPGPLADPLASFPPGDAFRATVLAPLMLESRCQTRPYSVAQLVRTVTHMSRGLFQIDGGIDALKTSFTDKVENNCGNFRDKVTVERLGLKRGKVREIVVRDRREVIGADVVMCNMDVKRFFHLFPEEDQKQRFHLRILELQPQYFLYTTNFVIKREAIPVGLGRHAYVVRDPTKPLEGPNTLLLCLDPGTDGPVPEDHCVISATMRLPVRQVRPSIESVDAYDDQILAALRPLIPFIDENLLARASAWVSYDKRTRQDFVDANNMTPIYGNPLDDTLETSAVQCRTAYKNVLVTGDNLHAGLGFEGAFLSSLSAVKITQELVDKKSLLN